MIPEEPRTSRLARRIADGDAIDWPAEIGAAETPDERETIAALRSIAAVSSLHQPRAEDERAEVDGLAQGASWGPLTIRSEIGRGQFGTVYLAWDPRLERQVALKVLHAGESAAAGTAIREARLLAKVRHPNVLIVHGAEAIDGRVGIWTEYIDGQTLEEELATGGPLPAGEVARIGTILCGALAAVHDAGLLHRDVKTQNVMRDRTGRIVLMDFGAGADMVAFAARDTMAGTPLYLAPELFSGSAPSIASDIYATGIMLFRLATGSMPVSGATFHDVSLAHDRRERVALCDAAPDVPQALADIVEKAIARSPEDRFSTAGAFGAALAEAEKSLGNDSNRSRSGALVIAGRVIAGGLLLVAAGFLVVWMRNYPVPWGTEQAAPAAPTILLRQVLPSIAPDLPSNPSTDNPSIVRLDSSIPDLVLTNLRSGETTRLHVKNDGPEVPGLPSQSTLSRDGSRVAFAWEENSASELRVLTIATHQTATVMRSADTIVPLQWSDDGRAVLVLLVGAGGSARAALANVGAAPATVDAAPRVIKTFEDLPLTVSLSHDDAFIAFDRPSSRDPARRDVAVASTVDGSEHVLIDHPADDLFPLWTPSGNSIVFASTRTGTLSLWMVDVEAGRESGAPRLLKEDIGRMWPLGFASADTLYFSARSGYVDVYTATLDAASGQAVDAPRPVRTRVAGTNISPAWSPDGLRLAYVAEIREGGGRESRALVVRSSDTGAERLLTPDMRFFIGPRWSPDGELVLVKGADGAGRWGLHAVDVGRGTAAPVLLGASLGQYLWSGDSGESGSVLYTVRGRIMRHRLADGSSSAGDTIFLDTRSEAITRMALSGDGRLAYSAIVQENGTRSVVLRVHDRNGDRELSRTTTPEALLCEGWSPDGRLVLFSRHREQTATSAATEPELLTVPGGGGDVRTTGLHLDGLRDVSLNPDGRQIAFTAGWPSRSLWAIEHLPSRAQDPGTGAHP